MLPPRWRPPKLLVYSRRLLSAEKGQSFDCCAVMLPPRWRPQTASSRSSPALKPSRTSPSPGTLTSGAHSRHSVVFTCCVHLLCSVQCPLIQLLFMFIHNPCSSIGTADETAANILSPDAAHASYNLEVKSRRFVLPAAEVHLERALDFLVGHRAQIINLVRAAPVRGSSLGMCSFTMPNLRAVGYRWGTERSSTTCRPA